MANLQGLLGNYPNLQSLQGLLGQAPTAKPGYGFRPGAPLGEGISYPDGRKMIQGFAGNAFGNMTGLLSQLSQPQVGLPNTPPPMNVPMHSNPIPLPQPQTPTPTPTASKTRLTQAQFDPTAYFRDNPTLNAAKIKSLGMTPYQHYVQYGFKAGRIATPRVV